MSKRNSIHIKIMLLQKGITQAEIARNEKVTEATISRVISGKRRSPHIRLAIAQACGVHVKELWPDEAA